MNEGTPLLSIDGALATVTLRRPSQRNSLTDEDLQCLLTHVQTLQATPEVAVVLVRADTGTQAQPVFSAGYHVGGFEDDLMAPLFFEKIPEAFEQLNAITVCALNGSVYGGATDLVLACDLRIAQAGTHWRMPACALGLHYYPSGLRRYISRLGLAWSKRAFLLGQAMPVEALADAALFEAVVAEADFEATVQRCVQALLRMAPQALKDTKRSLNEIAAGLYSEPALKERARRSVHSHDFAEGRAAFAQRRPPQFTGR